MDDLTPDCTPQALPRADSVPGVADRFGRRARRNGTVGRTVGCWRSGRAVCTRPTLYSYSPARLAWSPTFEEFIPKSLMRSFVVAVRGEVCYGLPEVALPERHDPIQTFLFDRAHEALRITVGIGRTIQRLDDQQAPCPTRR